MILEMLDRAWTPGFFFPFGSRSVFQPCCVFSAICKSRHLADLATLFPCSKDDVKSQIAQTVLKTISDYFVTVMASSLRQIKFVITKMEDIGLYTTEMAKLDA